MIEFELETGDKSFYCSECNKEFETQGGLKRHNTTQHAENNFESPGSTTPSKKKTDPIADQYETWLFQMGMFVSLFNKVDGEAIIKGSHNAAVQMGNFARTRPHVKRQLKKLFEINDYSMLIMSHSAILLPIYYNHKKPDKTTENDNQPIVESHNIFATDTDNSESVEGDTYNIMV